MEQQIPTQTFDMSTPPVTPRNAHDRPEVEDMDVDGTEEATTSTTGQHTLRMDQNMRRVLGAPLSKDPPPVSTTRTRPRTLRIAGVPRSLAPVTCKHVRSEAQAHSPAVKPHSSKPRLMPGKVDHPLAPEESYIRTREELDGELSMTEAAYLVSAQCLVIEISWDLSDEELQDLGNDHDVFLLQAAMNKKTEVSMRNASPELKASMKECQGI